jgi:DNA-binding transcriptional regulator YiaG
VEEILSYSRPYGVAGLMERALAAARQQTVKCEVKEVTDRIEAAQQASGLTVGQFATVVGTSRSRMSTYLSGKVMPSAAMLVRIERAAARERASSDAATRVTGAGRIPTRAVPARR